MSRRSRVARLVTVAVAAAVGLGAAPTAIASATDAQRAVSVSSVAHIVSPATTTVRNWGATSRVVLTGGSLRVHVRVSGGERAVRLERLLAGRWRVVDHATTTAAGRVTLHWRAPEAPKRATLRLQVLRTTTAAAALTASRVVTVRRPAAAPKPAVSAAEALRVQLLGLVNRARATSRTCGGDQYPAVPALHRSSALDRAAGDYATSMATKDFFSHVGLDGSTMVSRLKAVGITNTAERENIAAGQTSATSVMQAWLESPGHCANLMGTDVTRIGFGHAVGSASTYGQYWVQDFAG